jgi:hypothetical protein
MDYSYLFRHHRMAAPGPTEWTHAIDRIWEACHGSAVLREWNIQNDISQTHLWWYLYYKIVDGVPIKQFYSLWPLHMISSTQKNGTYIMVHIYIIYIYCFYVLWQTWPLIVQSLNIAKSTKIYTSPVSPPFRGAARTKRVISRKKRLGVVESRFFISSYADYPLVN